MFKLATIEEEGDNRLGFDSRSGCRRASCCPPNTYTTCPGKPGGRGRGPDGSQKLPKMVPPLLPQLMSRVYGHVSVYFKSSSISETHREEAQTPPPASLDTFWIFRRQNVSQLRHQYGIMVCRPLSPVFLLQWCLCACGARLLRGFRHAELLLVRIVDINDLLFRGFYYLHRAVALVPIIIVRCHGSRGVLIFFRHIHGDGFLLRLPDVWHHSLVAVCWLLPLRLFLFRNSWVESCLTCWRRAVWAQLLERATQRCWAHWGRQRQQKRGEQRGGKRRQRLTNMRVH